eukprot:6055834-Amphidinium_carterae.1
MNTEVDITALFGVASSIDLQHLDLRPLHLASLEKIEDCSCTQHALATRCHPVHSEPGGFPKCCRLLRWSNLQYMIHRFGLAYSMLCSDGILDGCKSRSLIEFVQTAMLAAAIKTDMSLWMFDRHSLLDWTQACIMQEMPVLTHLNLNHNSLGDAGGLASLYVCVQSIYFPNFVLSRSLHWS